MSRLILSTFSTETMFILIPLDAFDAEGLVRHLTLSKPKAETRGNYLQVSYFKMKTALKGKSPQIDNIM